MRLSEISLFLEQLLKVVNSNVVNQSASCPSLPTEEHPWFKFAGMYGDDFDWKTFQAGIDEYRRETAIGSIRQTLMDKKFLL